MLAKLSPDSKKSLESLTKLNAATIDKISLQMKGALNQKDIEMVVALIKQLLSQVDHQEHIKSEEFYHTLFQTFFSACEIKTQSEVSRDHGRINLILDLPHLIYLIEIKFNASAKKALAQIEDRKYYEAFSKQGKQILLLGLNFEQLAKVFEITHAYKSV